MYCITALHIVVLVLLSCSRLGDTRVKFEFGHFLQPVVSRAEDGNSAVLQNKDILVVIKCKASYPVEWVYNADDENMRRETVYRNEWTDRKFRRTIRDSVYEYIDWIQLQQATKLEFTWEFRCQAVDDHSDFIGVRFTPQSNTLQISSGHELPLKNIPSVSQQCKIKFTFLHVPGTGHFASCSSAQMPNVVGTIEDRPCEFSAAYCGNSFRDIKALLSACTERKTGDHELLNDGRWTRIGGKVEKILIPGTAVCSLEKDSGAQEYYFSAPDTSRARNIHLSWSEIQPKEMIWTTPAKFDEVYYRGQSIKFVCIVPKYGFSFDPVLVRRINNVTLEEANNFDEDQLDRTWKKTVKIDFDRTGFYENLCLGPVWNSTEWATKKIEFIVKDSVDPYFEKPIENFTLTVGDVNRKMYCRAQGDPIPKVEWIVQNNFPGIKVKDDALIFLSISDFLQGEYECLAKNSLGKTASKIISITVKKKMETDGIANGSTTTAVAVGSVAGVILLLVFLGFIFFYLKFKKLNTIIRGLTIEEILEFREGKKRESSGEILNSAEFIESLSYDNAYELTKSKFNVDTKQTLGSGAYGIVYKGIVKTEQGYIDAAFKTIRKDADKSYFKALLTELKILIHVGKHESIVNLIGAWTENIENREVFVAVELCQFSLQNFLRENSWGFVNYVKDGVVTSEPNLRIESYANVSIGKRFTTLNLCVWSKEIAAALDYIASKHIIHGDIAARNILLTSQLTAKLCDFGLARQLVDYNYVKSEQCPLPWKWMAIESLRQMHFSTKSDVWAYGITVWEIFSLGDIPYPGLAWSTEFADQLENGLRLTRPQYAPQEIWELMVECWHRDPALRPTFISLINLILDFEGNLKHIKQ